MASTSQDDSSLLNMPDDEEGEPDYMDINDVMKEYRPDDIGHTFSTAPMDEKIKGCIAMTSISIILLVALLLAAGAY
eukprot:gene8408-10204_t